MTKNEWQGKRVFITGVCGTVGQELLRQVLDRGVAEVHGMDNNEAEVFYLGETWKADSRTHIFLGDVRDGQKLRSKMRGMDIVLHAAALKHVIVCEQEPEDAVQTNIIGTQNVIDAAREAGVERVLFTSTDKAVNPTNVMGTTKLMGERLMTAAHAHGREGGPVFASTRFGNVLGSRGSVIPVFKRQLATGGPVTVTDPEMTRFIMTLDEAVTLVLDSVFMAKGGEVFVTKMPAIRIRDLAEVMVEALAPLYGHDAGDIEVQTIGAKAGEKMFEELMNDEETRRTVELPAHYVILPAFRSVYRSVDYAYDAVVNERIEAAYTSEETKLMPPGDLLRYLQDNDLIPAESRSEVAA